MAKAPAFQFYAQDFLTGVMYLTNEEIGIYIKMLAKQWTDGKIPKKRLGFLVGYDWDKLSEELRAKFTDLGEYVVNERLEKEREKKIKHAEKQSENGKKGGRPKKNTKLKDAANTDEETQLKANPLKNQKPNKSQKKPLEDEDEDEIEEEKEIRKRKGGTGGKTDQIEVFDPEIVHPWETETFRVQWQHWKIYKKKEFGFKFKSLQSEQAALTELANKSNSDEKTAIKIMHQSMSNGWKGFFELKNNSNGKTKQTGKSEVNYSDEFRRRIAAKMGS
jgi:uncharacterized protein YdaU (DUF1376 family)